MTKMSRNWMDPLPENPSKVTTWEVEVWRETLPVGRFSFDTEGDALKVQDLLSLVTDRDTHFWRAEVRRQEYDTATEAAVRGIEDELRTV